MNKRTPAFVRGGFWLQVQHVLEGHEKQIVELVESTYRLHCAGDSVNPPSYFLQFPDRPPPGLSRLQPRSAARCGWMALNGYRAFRIM